MRIQLLLILVLLTGYGQAQDITNVKELQADEAYDNIKVQRLYSDSHATNFVIWVKSEVRPHIHEHHSETLYVLEGEAEMQIGEKLVTIKPGDLFTVPEGTVHAVKVTSSEPLKVISTQSPEFLGKDRKFIE